MLPLRFAERARWSPPCGISTQCAHDPPARPRRPARWPPLEPSRPELRLAARPRAEFDRVVVQLERQRGADAGGGANASPGNGIVSCFNVQVTRASRRARSGGTQLWWRQLYMSGTTDEQQCCDDTASVAPRTRLCGVDAFSTTRGHYGVVFSTTRTRPLRRG
jgi:hypothetical protein